MCRAWQAGPARHFSERGATLPLVSTPHERVRVDLKPSRGFSRLTIRSRRRPMAKLLILYGKPNDPSAFEDYYVNRHLPFAGKKMPGVRGAETGRVIDALDQDEPEYYRFAAMSYDSVDALRQGIASEDGQAVIADLQ